MNYSRITLIGEPMLEVAPSPDTLGLAELRPGGDALGTAVYLKRMVGGDIAVRLVTVLGEDAFSERIIQLAKDEGIETDHIRRMPDHLCGLFTSTVSVGGESELRYWRNDSAARHLFDDERDFAAANDSDIVFLSGITLAILSSNARNRLQSWLHQIKGTGKLIAFSSNFVPSLWKDSEYAASLYSSIWRICDIALPSYSDEVQLFGSASKAEVLQRFQEYGVRAGALKLRDGGACVIGATGFEMESLHQTNIEDKTAEEDGFNAGYLASFLAGKSPVLATRAAQEQALEIIQHRGVIL